MRKRKARMISILALLIGAGAFGGMPQLWEAMRPPSDARWRAEMRAARRIQFNFVAKERHLLAACREGRKFGRYDIRLADSTFALADHYPGYPGSYNLPRVTAGLVAREMHLAAGPGPPSVKSTVTWLAECRRIHLVCDPERVGQLYTSALDLYEHVLPPDSIELADVYCKIASRRSGKEAILLYRRALAIYQYQRSGQERAKVLDTLRLLTYYYQETKQYLEAIDCYRQMIAIRRHGGRQDPGEQVDLIHGMGACYLELGDYQRGLSCYREVLAARERQFGQHSLELYWDLYHMQKAYEKAGDLQNAKAIGDRMNELERRNPDCIPH